MFNIPISPKKSPALICFSTSPESLYTDERCQKYKSYSTTHSGFAVSAELSAKDFSTFFSKYREWIALAVSGNYKKFKGRTVDE